MHGATTGFGSHVRNENARLSPKVARRRHLSGFAPCQHVTGRAHVGVTSVSIADAAAKNSRKRRCACVSADETRAGREGEGWKGDSELRQVNASGAGKSS